MKNLIKDILISLKLKKPDTYFEKALRIVNGKFAFCGASGAVPTGRIIEVQGRKFKEGRSICPVMDGPSVSSTALVPDPTVTPDGTQNTVWSYFWYYDNVPQAPTWET